MRAPAAFVTRESGFAKVVHTVSAFAPTGEPHIVLCGEISSGCIADIEDAALAAFDEYAAKHPGDTLYWRIVPEYRHDGGKGRGSFYMRLLISNKEIIERSENGR